MRQEVEIEFKNLLTQEEYIKLRQAFFNNDSLPFTQENHYFDTKEYTLKEHQCALRIRIKNSHAEMTLKTPFEGHHTETTVDLKLSDARKMIDEGGFPLPEDIFNVLTEEDISVNRKVFKVAGLKTERLEAARPHSIIVLDKSFYSNQVDFELEVESDSKTAGKKLFTQILDDYSIPLRSTETKIARAFNAKN